MRKKYSDLTTEARQRAVEREEVRVAGEVRGTVGANVAGGGNPRKMAQTMGQFFSHARGTGGGSPLYPPNEDTDETDFTWRFGDDDDDTNDNINNIPISQPPELQVMVPPSEPNLAIIQGPSNGTGVDNGINYLRQY